MTGSVRPARSHARSASLWKSSSGPPSPCSSSSRERSSSRSSGSASARATRRCRSRPTGTPRWRSAGRSAGAPARRAGRPDARRHLRRWPRERPNSLHVTVTGHQWWWQYNYAGEEKVTTANELHIPVGKPVRLALESADIIHSYWVPRLAGKQDVVPGRTNHVTIQADGRASTRDVRRVLRSVAREHAAEGLRPRRPRTSSSGSTERARGRRPDASALAAKGKRVFLGSAVRDVPHDPRC